MTNFSWSNPKGGSWSDPTNWSPHGVPGGGDDTLIQNPDLHNSFQIALDVSEIGSVTFAALNCYLVVVAAVRLEGTLELQSGSLILDQTIQGGTIVNDDGDIFYRGGTLDGVTINGQIFLGASDALTITDGITITGPGLGTIDDTEAGSSLTFSGVQTLHDIAISAGNADGTATLTTNDLTLDAGSSLTVNEGNQAETHTISLAGLVDEGALTLIDATGALSNEMLAAGTLNLVNSTVSAPAGASAGTITLSGSVLNADASFLATGHISLDASSTLNIGASADGDLTLAQLSSIDNQNGTVNISATIDLGGGNLNYTAGSPASHGFKLDHGTVQNGTIDTDGTGHFITGAGTLNNITIDGPLDLGDAGGEVDIEGTFGFTGTAPATINAIGADIVFVGNHTLDNVDIALGGTTITIALDSATNTLTFGPAADLTVTGGVTLNTSNPDYPNLPLGTFDNQGSIVVESGGLNVAIDSDDDFFVGSAFRNDGSLTLEAGTSSQFATLTNTSSLVVSGAGVEAQMLDSSGLIQIVEGGSLGISKYAGSPNVSPGTLENDGTIQLGSGGTLMLQNGSYQLGKISFLDASGTLVLTTLSSAYYFPQEGSSGTLDMFQSGDKLDIGNALPTYTDPNPVPYTLSHSGNTLTVFQGTSVFDSFTLTGQDYTNATFTLAGDVVTTDAPCFCAGTLILTADGERLVEDLEIGNVVLTRQDGIEHPMTIRWTGRRRVVPHLQAEPERAHPIRIAADAIAPGIPKRDLLVSPDHALLLDGMLIQARQLVNDMTIRRERGHARVTYHHVELDRHAILLANGMPCESYLDSGNRTHFDSPGMVVRLHDTMPTRAQSTCAPFVTAADRVLPVWQRLADRASAAGLAPPPLQLHSDPGIRLEMPDGTCLSPIPGSTTRFALPHGCRRLRLRSHSDYPTTLAPWSDDRRRLGIALGAIRLHRGPWQRLIPLDTLDAAGGWWPIETAGDLGWRWTDGDAGIDVPEAADTIELALHAIMQTTIPDAAAPYAEAC